MTALWCAPPSQLAYAHDHEPLVDLVDCIQALRPTALIGVSAQPQTFLKVWVSVSLVLSIGRTNRGFFYRDACLM
jgi:hypothetical protein